MSAPSPFDCLCSIVADLFAPQARARPLWHREAESLGWDRIVQVADQNLFVPQLYEAVAQRPEWSDLPAELRNYLKFIHERNALRNASIRDQCLEIHRTLRAAGIGPVFLKGSAFVLADRAAGAPWRMLADADVLVRESDLAAAYELLIQAGYSPARPPTLFEARRHLAPLSRPDVAASVEVHRHLSDQRTMLSPDEVFRDAVAIDGGDGPRIPSPAHRLVHCVLHWQMQDIGYGTKTLPPRPMADIARLWQDPAIDRARSMQQAAERGYDRWLTAALHIVERAFGVPANVSAAPWVEAHLAACWKLEGSLPRRRRVYYFNRLLRYWDARRIAYTLGYANPQAPGARMGVMLRRWIRLPKICVLAVVYGVREMLWSAKDFLAGRRG